MGREQLERCNWTTCIHFEIEHGKVEHQFANIVIVTSMILMLNRPTSITLFVRDTFPTLQNEKNKLKDLDDSC